MKLGLRSLACTLAYCIGCTNTPYHPFTNPADAGSDGEAEASEQAEAAPVVYSAYCCKQALTVQPCNDSYTWGCEPDPNQPYSYDCYTPFCSNANSVGLKCIGVDGPGTVVPCP